MPKINLGINAGYVGMAPRWVHIPCIGVQIPFPQFWLPEIFLSVVCVYFDGYPSSINGKCLTYIVIYKVRFLIWEL